jgi:hypothetical protein
MGAGSGLWKESRLNAKHEAFGARRALGYLHKEDEENTEDDE